MQDRGTLSRGEDEETGGISKGPKEERGKRRPGLNSIFPTGLPRRERRGIMRERVRCVVFPLSARRRTVNFDLATASHRLVPDSTRKLPLCREAAERQDFGRRRAPLSFPCSRSPVLNLTRSRISRRNSFVEVSKH